MCIEHFEYGTLTTDAYNKRIMHEKTQVLMGSRKVCSANIWSYFFFFILSKLKRNIDISVFLLLLSSSFKNRTSMHFDELPDKLIVCNFWLFEKSVELTMQLMVNWTIWKVYRRRVYAFLLYILTPFLFLRQKVNFFSMKLMNINYFLNQSSCCKKGLCS